MCIVRDKWSLLRHIVTGQPPIGARWSSVMNHVSCSFATMVALLLLLGWPTPSPDLKPIEYTCGMYWGNNLDVEPFLKMEAYTGAVATYSMCLHL